MPAWALVSGMSELIDLGSRAWSDISRVSRPATAWSLCQSQRRVVGVACLKWQNALV